MKSKNLLQWKLMLGFLACGLTMQFSMSVFGQETFRVTAVSLKPEPSKYFTCPARIVFNGYITANAAGTVKYTFVSSDGGEYGAQVIKFEKPGTMAVSTNWTIGSASRTTDYEGWKTLRILEPNETESSQAEGSFAVHCKPGSSAPGLTVGERIELKNGERIERGGQIEAGKNSYIYAVHLERNQRVNLAAVFRDNTTDRVFRDNVIPAIELRGIYKTGDADSPLVGSSKDGKWSGAVAEPGDYLIVVSRPAVKGGEREIFPFKLLVLSN